MEQFQVAYVGAIAAAAGCIIGNLNIDDGVDALLSHKSDHHLQLSDKVARLEVQFKATHVAPPVSGGAQASLARDRFEYFATPNPTIHKIVVVLQMPELQECWVTSQADHLLMRHCAYWVNLAGNPLPNGKTATVHATSVFDDIELCRMMQRIGEGSAP